MGPLGTGEILVIAIVALLVLGPEKLPKAARQAGEIMRELRKLTSEVKTEVDKAMNQVEESTRPGPFPQDPDSPNPEEKPRDAQQPQTFPEAEPVPKHPGTTGFELIDQHDEQEPRDQE
jgi:sec-independent protein translocase protein TatB